MADIQSNIQVNIDTGVALANLKNLQRQLANFTTSFSQANSQAIKAQNDFSKNLVNSINATDRFAAGIQNIQSTTERFTESLEKNKFTTREYFRYAAGSTKLFSKLFTSEFNTIQKVAEDRVKDLQTQYIKMGRNATGALQAISIKPLTLDMEDLATKVAVTSQKQQIFGQLLKQGSTNLLNFGKNTQWAGRQLMVGFTIPLTIFGSKASQVFMDLEMQAIRFKRVYGEMFTTQAETTKALNEVRKLAQEFTKYGVAVSDTMKMAADAAAQGKQGADLMAQVAEATRLAVLGQVEQQQALETTMSLQNAFGYSAEQLAAKIDFLNAVENQTIVGIEDLTIAIPKAGPVVKQLGGSVEDLAFFLTAMKEGGINASEGANALKSGLASLINPTDKASGMLADLGINIKGIVEANKGDVKGTVIAFAEALDTLAPLERARAIEQLFGKFQFARLSTLFQNVTRDGGQAARTLDLTSKSVEELAILSERELGAVEDATGTKFKKAMENLKTSIAPVGEQFLKAVTPIAEFFSKILERFNGLSDGMKSGIARIALIIGGVGPVLLMTFGLLANGLANIIKLFALVRNGFLGLGKNSEFLGNQTNYLSSEQAEATIIASSLEQVHSKLIQTFTTEKIAVAQLAEIYGIAATQAARLQQTSPSFFKPGRRPQGYAKGIVSVPGPKGAGDIIPAMLSPGEAVIPAEQNKKYGGMVQSIISDSVPGFARGTFYSGQFTGPNPLINVTNGAEIKAKIDQILGRTSSTGLNKAPRETQGVASHLEGLTPSQLAGTLKDPEMQRVLSLMPDVKVGLRVLSTTTNDLVTIAKPMILSLKDLSSALTQNNVSNLTAVGTDRFSGTTVPTSSARNLMLNAAGIAGEPRTIKELTAASEKANLYASSGKASPQMQQEAMRLVQEKNNINQQLLMLTEKERIQKELEYSRMKSAAALEDALIKNGVSTKQASVRANQEILNAEKNMQPLLLQAKSEAEKQLILEKSHTAALLRYSGTFAGYNELKTNTQTFNKTQLNAVIRDMARGQIQFGTPYGAGEQVPQGAGLFGGRSFKGITGNRVSRTQSAIVDAGIRDTYYADKKSVSGIIKESYNVGSQTAQGYIQGAKDTAETRSPSRVMYNEGVNLARGAINGFRDAAKKLTRSGRAGELLPAEKANLPKYTREGLKLIPQEKTKQNIDAEKQQRRVMFARTNGILFGMSTLSSVLGMMGNGVAQKAAPFLVAMNVATIALQMIQGPWSALAVGAVALVGGIYYLHQKSREAAKQMSKLVDSLSATSQRISDIGKVTGKVGASEIMERRRQGQVSDRYTTGFNRAGQQFGTTFLESDVGKNILASFQQSLKTNGQSAIKQLGNQLAIYVSQGLMDEQQAESIARAIGVSMSDMTITSKIIGDLRQLIGPGGADLLRDPLQVRVNIITDARQITRELEAASKKVPQAGNATQQAFQAGIRDEKMLAATAASNVQNLETVQQQIDSQNKMYDDQILSLRKDKEKTKDKKEQLAIENQINELLVKRKEDEQILRNQGKQILADQIALFKSAKIARQDDTLQVAIKEQVKTRFAENPFTEALLSATEGLGRGGKKELEVMINTVVGSGVATPQAMVNMINMFGQDTKGLEQTFTALFETQDPGKAQELINIFNSLGGREGASKQVLAKIMTQITSKEGAAKFDKRLSALQLLMQMDGKEINVGAMIETKDGLAKLDAISADLEKIEQINTPITKTVITELEGTLGLEEGGLRPLIDDWEEFGKLPEEIKKTAIQTYVSIYRTIGDAERGEFVQRQIAGAGSARNAEAVAAAARKASTAEIAFDLYEPILKALGIESKATGKGGATGKDKKRSTILDDLLMRLKMVQDSSINATKGLQELMRVMSGKGKISLTKFEGVDQQLLRNGKVSKEFLDFVDALGPEGIQEDLKKFVTEGQKGILTLNEAGKALMRGMVAAKLGEYQENISRTNVELNNQIAATSQLVAAGFTFAEAQELAKDSTVALAIANNQLSTKQLIELKNQTRELTKAQQEYDRVTKIALMDEMDGQVARFEIVQKFVALQEQLIENQYASQKSILNSRQAGNQYALEKISQQEEKINQEYDKRIEALDKIAAKQEEINQIEQRRFNLAEALASGNMASVARTIQEIKQAEALAQIERKRKAIEDARKKQLAGIQFDGKTRQQIETDNKAIANSLADIEEKIRLAKNALDDQLKKTIGMTRVEIESAVLGITAALDAGIDPSNKDFLGQILRGVIGDANNTVTALKTVGTEIETLLAKQAAAKAALGSGSFGDQALKTEQEAKVAADAAKSAGEASAKLAENQKTIGVADSILVGGEIIKVSNNLPSIQAAQKEKMRREFLRSVGIPGFMSGGMVPKYFANGGYARGTDIMPAMLTPGEFVVQKRAVDMFGTNVMNSINNGELPGNSVYNYSLSVNVSNSNANANDIARTVMSQIKQIDAQRIRGSR